MPESVRLESLAVDLKDRFSRDTYKRAATLTLYLVQTIKRAYLEKLTATRGESGAVGGLLGEVKRAEDFLSITLGTSKAAHYLANLEFGEKGTQSTPIGGALFQRTKAPKSETIHQWILRAGIEPKEDPLTKKTPTKEQLAYIIAQYRKKHGIAALRIIERVLREQDAKIRSYLASPT